MFRHILVLDIWDKEKGVPVTMVKSFNDPDKAQAYLREFCNDLRPNTVWKERSKETLRLMAPGAVLSLSGYNKSVMPYVEVVTVYLVQDEDPENDCYQLIMRDAMNEMTQAMNEMEDRDDCSHLEYYVEVTTKFLQYFLEKENDLKTWREELEKNESKECDSGQTEGNHEVRHDHSGADPEQG